ncbi:MAG: methylated-DNA--[protein]-cysteine S-methyltransferase [Bacteroidota bacterium]|nr:methylated-DNA--[protein]-cysteine S-methyltransferase [Bacteroidota bacterium]
MKDSIYNYYNSPLGIMELVSNSTNNLIACSFIELKGLTKKKQPVHETNLFTETKKQLNAYFNSKLQIFELPIHISGTDFQKKVWGELIKINFGKTTSYLQMAKNLGDPKCIRAAASANGKNPFAIIIPCHRVIGTNGSLTGYAGELWRKEWLLNHEQLNQQTQLKL